jgi:hypothetical protein
MLIIAATADEKFRHAATGIGDAVKQPARGSQSLDVKPKHPLLGELKGDLGQRLFGKSSC